MIDWTTFSIGVGVTIFAYYLLLRTVPHLPKSWRRGIVFGYIALHLGSWGMMHLLMAIPFAQNVRKTHADALAHIPLEVAEYKSWEANPNPEYIRHIQKHVNPEPRYSFWSISPAPFILLTNEIYVIGPLWGRGDTGIYVWNLFKIKCVAKGLCWIS
jgi:hypothetical protein